MSDYYPIYVRQGIFTDLTRKERRAKRRELSQHLEDLGICGAHNRFVSRRNAQLIFDQHGLSTDHYQICQTSDLNL